MAGGSSSGSKKEKGSSSRSNKQNGSSSKPKKKSGGLYAGGNPCEPGTKNYKILQEILLRQYKARPSSVRTTDPAELDPVSEGKDPVSEETNPAFDKFFAGVRVYEDAWNGTCHPKCDPIPEESETAFSSLAALLAGSGVDKEACTGTRPLNLAFDESQGLQLLLPNLNIDQARMVAFGLF